MGTRNLEVVILNGEVRVAQYCQWDGYPSGQGLQSLKFFRDKMNRKVFEEKIQKSSWITTEEFKQLWIECGASPDSDLVNFDVSNLFKTKNPHLHRDCGAKIFELIQNSENGLKLNNNIEFAADSLFCEWAYVIDLDKNTFEVYKGFNKRKLGKQQRFYHLQKENENSEYYPIRMKKSYDLNQLPTDEEFLKIKD